MLFKVNRYSNVNIIIKDYLAIFLRQEKNNDKVIVNKTLVFFYILLPVIYSVILVITKVINVDILNIVGIIFSILLGVLFTFLSMLISVSERLCSSYRSSTRNKVVKEVFTVIMFEIALSIIVLIMTMFFFFVDATNQLLIVFKYIANFIYYALVLIFLFNFTIILKRVYNLISDIFNNN